MRMFFVGALVSSNTYVRKIFNHGHSKLNYTAGKSGTIPIELTGLVTL